MVNSQLLQAFNGTNERIPVWFMRQAGRYLPEYQAIRRDRTLNEMFRNPEVVADVTCLPIDILEVDAAILFADILTLPSGMGFDIVFEKDVGPVIGNPVVSAEDVEELHDFVGLSYVSEAIELINQRLPVEIPLIGFAGGPFTVLCYLIEGGSSYNFSKTFKFIQEQPEVFELLMKKLTENTIDYLNFQKKAGIDVFQLFDTWAGILRPADYEKWVFPYVDKIFEKVNLPSIYFAKNASHLLSMMDRTSSDFLSVCHTVVLGENPVLNESRKGVQGNLFTGLLYAKEDVLEREVEGLLKRAQKYKKYIFNLSHGVAPDVKVETLKKIVEKVHAFPWKS